MRMSVAFLFYYTVLFKGKAVGFILQVGIYLNLYKLHTHGSIAVSC